MDRVIIVIIFLLSAHALSFAPPVQGSAMSVSPAIDCVGVLQMWNATQEGLVAAPRAVSFLARMWPFAFEYPSMAVLFLLTAMSRPDENTLILELRFFFF